MPLKLSMLVLPLCMVLSATPVWAEGEEGEGKQVMINAKTFSVKVMHNGEEVEIMRNQDRDNVLNEHYQPTHRGTIQAMNPFKPHAVETIAELEMLEYLQKQGEDDSIIVIDSRTAGWVARGTIPGSVNISYKEFEDVDNTAAMMEEQFGAISEGSVWDFTYAKTLVMFCNGPWCGQSPTAIKKLLRAGYPAHKIKYYRGGMQSWEGLGLTVVDE
jgi:rhodanese-related sulfurtransferase